MICLQADGEDELKKRQLMELAIINGTYRDSNAKALAVAGKFCDNQIHNILVTNYNNVMHLWNYLEVIFGKIMQAT